MTLEVSGNTAIVNGKTVPLAKKPKIKTGQPKVESRTSMIGDSVVVTQAKDFSEAVGEVTLSVRNTVSNIKMIEEWQDNIGKNAIRILDNDTGYTKTFKQMSIEEDVEFDFDSEETEVVFKGGQGR